MRELMTFKGATVAPLLALLLFGLICFAEVRSSEVLWLDFDMKDIPEPKERDSGLFDPFVKGQFIEGTKQNLDAPRWVRRIAGRPKQASNVNQVDEVPNSSWYTNRHRIRRMTPDALERGPNTGPGPMLSNAVITSAKPSGVTPGMMLKDGRGDSYLIKFDNANYPNLQSGAEVIITKIMYAAGYNVPENYVAYLDADSLKIGDDVQITDRTTGKKRQLTKDDVDEMLRRAARTPDGRYRVLASKVLPGKAKGPFAQVGLRTDDPNDLIPHEHRRELRGLRVIGSWVNNWDLKEAQSLDMYVEESGRKFLRHYLLDFGSALGAADHPDEYYHGREYGFDVGGIAREIVTLGIHESANEKVASLISSEVGSFTSHDFDPGNWKPTFPSVMFSNLTDLDAFWAVRVILSFSEDDLRQIVRTAEYSDDRSNDYIVRTLMERRQNVARHWLGKVDALSDFSTRQSGNGVAIAFRDLMIDETLAMPDGTEYTYEVRGPSYKSTKKAVARPEITIDRETLGAATERGRVASPIEVRIWAHRGNLTSDPVRIHFDWSPNRGTFSIRRIARG